jgi:AraC-like DNA-binding protein
LGLLDLLKEVPLSAVLRERLAIADAEMKRMADRISQLEKENAELLNTCRDRAKSATVTVGALRVLDHLVRNHFDRNVTTGQVSTELGIDRQQVLYYFDQLAEVGWLALGTIAGLGNEATWIVTPKGRSKGQEIRNC